MKNRIRELRKTAGMTQNDLAEQLDITRAHLSRLENGQISLTEEMIKKLTKVFGVTADYLLELSDLQENALDIPDELKNMYFAFHRGEFEDLTQDEVEALAVLARTLKEQRKRKEEGD